MVVTAYLSSPANGRSSSVCRRPRHCVATSLLIERVALVEGTTKAHLELTEMQATAVARESLGDEWEWRPPLGTTKKLPLLRRDGGETAQEGVGAKPWAVTGYRRNGQLRVGRSVRSRILVGGVKSGVAGNRGVKTSGVNYENSEVSWRPIRQDFRWNRIVWSLSARGSPFHRPRSARFLHNGQDYLNT